MQIKLLWMGKTKSSPIRYLSMDYLERIRRMVFCDVIEVRDVSRRRSLRGSDAVTAEGIELARHVPEHCRLVAMDEKGTQFTSLQFAQWFESEQNRGTRLIVFVIGGPEGLSPMNLERASITVSLGKMTWTHEMCRLLLLEQVYRALCILCKIPYHK